jgi:cell division septum initiation protein DivIVA
VADDDLDERVVAQPGADAPLDLAEILDELARIVEHAKSMPLSSSAIIGRDEVLGLLDEARDALPAEFQRARRVLQDREEVRARAAREADELLDEARAQAAHMVQRTEIVRQARNNAERILADVEAENRRIRHEADDYVDRKLAAFEIVLDRTIRTVQAGRDRLSVSEDDDSADELGEMDAPEDAFFDQDRQ